MGFYKYKYRRALYTHIKTSNNINYDYLRESGHFIGDKLGISSELRTTDEERRAIEEQAMKMAEQSLQAGQKLANDQAQAKANGKQEPTPAPQAQAPEAALEKEMRA